jgi:hypothetical protein
MELKYGMKGENNFKIYPPLFVNFKMPDDMTEEN